MKKVKHVVQYASFAAYHLSRETSFLADEGATLPKIPPSPSMPVPAKILDADARILKTSVICDANQRVRGGHKRLSSCSNDAINCFFPCSEFQSQQDISYRNTSQLIGDLDTGSQEPCEPSDLPNDVMAPEEMIGNTLEEEKSLELHKELIEAEEGKRTGTDCENEAADYFSAADNQSILVSLSTTCVLKGTVCEPSKLFRIKFYGSFDKPLGRYLRDDLFDQVALSSI